MRRFLTVSPKERRSMFFKQMLKKNKIDNKTHCILFAAVAGTLAVFLLFMTISTIVGISNKVKEGRYIGQEIESKNTITVSDSGEVYAKPDLALVSFSVITEARTVAEAVDQNAAKMNQIISFAKRQGVKEKDLKTTVFSINPRYEYQRIHPTGKRVLVGYEVRQTLQVKIRDLDKISQILQGATDAGANQVGSLQFTIDEEDELRKEAREEAIKKAKAKAKELAKQLGVSLVRITSFNESGPSYYPFARIGGEAMSVADEEAPQIETGENKIEVTVSITYEIH